MDQKKFFEKPDRVEEVKTILDKTEKDPNTNKEYYSQMHIRTTVHKLNSLNQRKID